MNGIFRILGHSVEDYCFSSGVMQGDKAFLTTYKEKNLFISLKRYPSSDDIRTVVGTVVEFHSGKQNQAVNQTKELEIVKHEKLY